MRLSSERLGAVLVTAHASLESAGETLAQADRLRGLTNHLTAQLRRRPGLAAAQGRRRGILADIAEYFEGFERAASHRKKRLRQRILGLHLRGFWRAIRWWLLLVVVIAAFAALTLFVLRNWSWISQTVFDLIGAAPVDPATPSVPAIQVPAVQAPGFIGPAAPSVAGAP